MKTRGLADEMKSALDKLTKKVIDMPGVTGTAIGLSGGKPCLKVFVSGRGGASGKIPSSMDGHRVVVEKTGTFKRY